MPSSRQDREFAEHIQPPQDLALLDKAIEWIRSNLSPENVFSEKDLQTWAEDNGYRPDEEPGS